MTEYACIKCMWVGEKPDNEKCPECGVEIEYVKNEPIWNFHENDFSWNKK